MDEEEAAPVDKVEQVHGVSEEDMPNPNTFSVLWNSMIVPFLRSAIYGVIWYQGETDTIAPTSYECTYTYRTTCIGHDSPLNQMSAPSRR